jgi:hypothetical protein
VGGAVVVVALVLAFVFAGGSGGTSNGGVPGTSAKPTSQPPSATVVKPTVGTTVEVGQSFPIQVSVTPSSGIKEVVVYVNGSEYATLTTAPWTVKYSPTEEGNLEIKATATDDDSRSASAVPITVGAVLSPSTPSPTTATGGGTTDVATQVQAAIDQWVQATVDCDAVAEADAYAQNVIFFGKRDTHAQVLQAKEKALSLFSVQQTSVSNVSITPLGTGLAQAVFDKTWDFQGSKNFSGSAHDKLIFQLIGGSWKIISEAEPKVYWVKR